MLNIKKKGNAYAKTGKNNRHGIYNNRADDDSHASRQSLYYKSLIKKEDEMRIFFGIVLIIIGLVMVYYLPEIIIRLWPVEAGTITETQTFLLTIIVSLPIIIPLITGLILLKKSK